MSVARRAAYRGVSILVLCCSVFAAPAAASWHYLHAHINARGGEMGCEFQTWYSLSATCRGVAEPGHAGLFEGRVVVSWSHDRDHCYDWIYPKRPDWPPSYYNRCMILRTNGASYHNVQIPGDKQAVIVGGVQMPNGMFYLLGGWYDGHPVEPSVKLWGTESQGGPLYLWVGYAGEASRGPTNHYYVFGFRGQINY